MSAFFSEGCCCNDVIITGLVFSKILRDGKMRPRESTTIFCGERPGKSRVARLGLSFKAVSEPIMIASTPARMRCIKARVNGVENFGAG